MKTTKYTESAKVPRTSKALLELQMKADKDKRERYPNVPDHCIPKSKFSDKTANKLTQSILTWLELNGCWATRVNTTGRMLKGTEYMDVLGHKKQLPGTWIPGTTKRGTADIHAVVNGRHVSIEVKIGRDRMSDTQHKTKEAIEQSGGIYLIIKTFDEFMAWYRVHDLKKTK